jgi:hypothetical protein
MRRQVDFRERVINFLTGVPAPASPATNNRGPFIPPLNGSPNLNNFNAPNDNTVAYIMTPNADGQKPGSSIIKYTNKMREVERALQDWLPGIRIIPAPYVRLNYGLASDEAQIGTNERGQYLFQYDPNSDGNGQRAWRLFNEAAVAWSNV